MEPSFTEEEVLLLRDYIGQPVVLRTENFMYEFGQRIDSDSNIYCCMQNNTRHRAHKLRGVSSQGVVLDYDEELREVLVLLRSQSDRCSFLFGRNLFCERLEFITEIEADGKIILKRDSNCLPEDITERCKNSEWINIYGED